MIKGHTEPAAEGIAIIGMAGRFPGARNLDEFWEVLKEGRETIRHFTDEDLAPWEFAFDEVKDDPSYVKARGVLDDVEMFDAKFFGFMPREASVLDPQHRIWLECAWQALEVAGYAPEKYDGAIGVYAGGYITSYLLHNLCVDREYIERMIRFRSVDAFQTIVGNDKDYLPTRTAYKLNLTGPAVNVQSGCSTSLVAVCQACQSLLHYESDICLAGGVCITFPQYKGYLYQEGGMVSPDGRCRAFDAKAAGTVFSNGVGVVVLKRLEDALADGDHIEAVILGSALNNDGSLKVSYTAPSIDGQAQVIAMAQAMANVDLETISYIEAHGTGTPLGDPIEVAGLAKAFRAKTQAKQYCGLGSVKTNVGHLDSASGVAGLIKTVLALRHKQIPPTLHYQAPNPEIDFESSPFYVVTELQDWASPKSPRRAGVSSFGVGGTNAHVVLEEAPEPAPSSASREWQLLPVSAKTATALDASFDQIGAHLDAHADQSLADLAYTLKVGRADFEHRGFVVCNSHSDGARVVTERDKKQLATGVFDGTEPSVVFMFPGQGAQHVNMGRGLYEREPTFKACVDACSDILQPLLDVDLRALLYPAKAEDEEAAGYELKQTKVTQPALFVIEYALAKLWMEWGIEPAAMIGHSVGEYVAAALSGVFSMEDAVRLLAERARLMQDQPSGSMMAVRLSLDEIQPYLANGVSLAACNAPSLCVVSGPKEHITELDRQLQEKRVGAKELHTSHAFHSAMMDPVLEPFTERVRMVQRHSPRIPFISSLTGTWIGDDEATDSEYWSRQIRNAVLFSPGVRELQKDAGRILLEVGPSKTLSTLALQHAGKGIRQTVIASLSHAQERQPDGQCILNALGRLWVAGFTPDWQAFYQREARRRVILPTYPFERKRFWIDPPKTSVAAGRAASAPAAVTPEAPATEAATPVVEELEGTREDRLLARLRALFYDLSGIELEDTDPSTTFLELGLDSLFLTQASAALQQEFGVKITFRQLLEDVTSFTELVTCLAEQLPDDTFASTLLKSATEPPSAIPGDAGVSEPPVTTPALDIPDAPEKAEKQAAGERFGPYKKIEKSADGGLTAAQREHLDKLIARFSRKTKESKRLADAYRVMLADPRSVAGFRLLWKEMVYQVTAARSEGSRIWDVDGNEYVDITMCFGANILGHNPPFIRKAIEEQLKKGFEIGPQSPLAGKVAELVREFTGMERATFCNTGSEAVMATLRMARTVTGRTRFAFFSGDYHGTFDEVLARDQIVRGKIYTKPAAPGIPETSVQHNLILDYGTDESLAILKQYAGQLAAILVEPVQSRHPDVRPRAFLHALRALTRESGTALIFDEVITGFRVGPGGAQAYYDVRADLASYGKILGGGLPIGLVAGHHDFMDSLDGGEWHYGDDSLPEADVTFFAGTFVRHPLALAAAYATLKHLKEQGPGLQEELAARTTAFAEEVNAFFTERQVPIRVLHFSSWYRFDYPYDLTFAQLLFYHLLEKGVYIREAAQNCFFSAAHTDEDTAFIIKAIKDSVVELQEAGFLPALGTATRLPPAGEQGSDGSFPLTEAQKEIWLASQMGGDAVYAYDESFSLRLRGPFNEEAFREAVQKVVGRHEELHARFRPDGETQVIQKDEACPMECLDFSTAPAAERQVRIDELIKEDQNYLFDLERGPLYRLQLVKLEPEDHLFIFSAHHIVCDGWSSGVILDEISVLYSARCLGQSCKLEEATPFSEFAQILEEQRTSAEMAQALDYWKAQFAELPTPLDLPTDRPRPPLKSFKGSTVKWKIDPAVYGATKKAAAANKATLFVLLLSVFKLLLNRLSGKGDVVVGIPSSGQAMLGKNALVGHGVNLLPMRSRLEAGQTFKSYLATVRAGVLDAYDHYQCTMGTLLTQLKLPRDPSRLPLVEIIFNLDRDRAGLGFHGLEASVEQNPKRAVNFDLFFNFNEDDDGLTLMCDYNTDLFDESTVQRWLRHFETLLESIAVNPDETLGKLPLLDETQRAELLENWNQTERTYPAETCIHQLFEKQAAANPGATALLFEGQELTFEELNQRANRLAHRLQKEGIGPETLVGIYLERSVDMVVAVWAVLKAGGAYVPLDPSFPPDRLAIMLEDCGAPVVLTQEALLDVLPAGPANVLCLDRDGLDIEKESSANVKPAATSRNLAYVIYTSGSTGKPKGVQIEHRSVVNFLNSMAREPGLTAEDTLVAVTTLSFDIAGLELFLPLMVGARLVLVSREVAVDGVRLLESIDQHSATVLQATPATWRLLLEAGWPSSPSLKILCGGEALPRDLANRLLEKGSSLWNLYGPTETTIWSAVENVKRGRGPVRIGHPIDNTQIHVLDPHLQPVPIGVAGELHIGGAGLARGYLHRPELTEERFIADPFRHEPGARLYKTGDLVRRLPDGNIEFLGRIDFQVKVRGYRIEPGEIEFVLGRHPGVREAVVVARSSSSEEAQLVAYVVSAGESPAAVDLRAHLRDALPEYMVPSAFVFLDEFPLTPNRKVNRKALPAPDAGRDDTAVYVAPSSDLEKDLVASWEKLLGVNPVGVTDNFFDLGGHSLLAVRLFIEVEKTYGKRFPLATLFQAPTIRQLAALLGKKDWTPSWSALVPIQPNGSRPPFYCIHGAGGNVLLYRELARHLAPDQPFYGLQARGMDGEQPFLTSIEDMAADYAKEIQAFQPEGPYYLGGYCLGGTIAFEAAQQLRAKGHEVGLVALLDTHSEWRYDALPRQAHQLIQKLLFHAASIARSGPSGARAFIAEKSREAGRRFNRRVEVFQSRLAHRLHLRREDPLVMLEKIHDHASVAYKPRHYAGEVSVFKPMKAYAGYGDPVLGWGNGLTRGVDLHELHCYPASMLVEPFVDELAEQLQGCLNRAQARANAS